MAPKKSVKSLLSVEMTLRCLALKALTKLKHGSLSTGVALMSYLVHQRSKRPWNLEMQLISEVMHLMPRPWMILQMSRTLSLRIVLWMRMVMGALQLNQRKK